jgi:hypothetical protein
VRQIRGRRDQVQAAEGVQEGPATGEAARPLTATE